MTPKSLLRMKEAGSPAAELSQTGFQPVRDDAMFSPGGRDASKVRRVVACSGKVYYDLEEARGDRDDVAIVRLELLYPFPETPLHDLRNKYRSAQWVFCQEEPQNMGAWTFVRDLFPWVGNACRPAAASPATGSLQRHKQEQADVVKRALGS
jgi:2-oxoglutarate dehydrogenase E1 component